MNTKHIVSLVALVASGLVSSTAFAAVGNLVVNGGFEANTGDQTCASGWSCSNGSNFGEQAVSFWNGQMSGSNLVASPTGGNVLATWYIDAPNTLSQQVGGLTVGSNYSLSFSVASANRDNFAANVGTVGWQVSADNTQLGTASVAIAGKQSSTAWSTFNYNFVATSAAETLKFLSVSSVAVAPEPILLLDGVNITAAVPEPSTYALMGAGLLAIGGIARRRQARAAE